MEEFMSPQTFDSFLMFKVTIAIVAAYYFCKFAQRDATAFDTIYRKRIRYVYVVLIGASVVWSLIQIFKGPFDFSLPFYNMSVYGTPFPSEAMLETGIEVNANVHFSYETCRWSRLTFEQWNLSTGIANFIVGVGLLIYILRYRRSSVRWNVKIRKFIGYILLYVSPATIAHSFHYFSLDEFSVVAIYIGITYLCCRTYNWDAVPAKLPKESISHPNVPEFEAIPPEDKSRIGIKDYISITKEDIKEDFEALKKWAHKLLDLQCWIGVFLLILLNVIFIYRAEYGPRINGDNPSFQKFNVWIYDGHYKGAQEWEEKLCKVDYSLGEPINGNLALTKSSVVTSRFEGCNNNALIYEWYRYYEIITYDISSKGYGSDNGFKYLEDIARKHGGKTTRDNPYYIDDYSAVYSSTSSLSAPVYGITENALIDLYNELTIVHYVFSEGDYAYEIRVYYLKDVRGEQLIKNIYFQNPFKVDYALYILVTILIISSILYVIFTYKKQQIAIINSSARRLFNYIVVATLIQVLMVCCIIAMTCITHEHDEDYYLSTITISIGTFLNLLLAYYVSKLVALQNSYDYLLPEWYKEKYVAAFNNKVLCSKMSLVLLFYPLFYLATLPFGIFVFIYLVPIAAIFGIAYLVNWIFKDNKLITRPLLKNERKQDKFMGDTLKEKLQLLKSMLDEGLITQEDYDRKKAEILDKFQD